MSGKSDFVDYEPLRRPRRPDESESEDFPARKTDAFSSELESRFDQPSEAEPVPRTHQQPKVNEARPALAAPTEESRWSFKRGHAISFAGLFMFTFLVYFRPYEYSPSLMWLSRSALVTAIITLVAFVPTQLGLENRITIRPREINMVLLLVVFALLSVPFAADRLRAWNSFVEFSKVVAMFIVLANVVRTQKRLKALLLLVLAATVFLSITALNDYRTGALVLGGTRIEGAIGNLFDNPNDLALHLVTFLPIIIGLALGSRFLFAKLFYFLVALTMLGATVVTFSRGGFLGLIAVAGTLVWKLGKQNRFLIGIVGVVLVVSFIILAPGAYRQRVTNINDDSAGARTGELKRSVYLAIRHPIFGVGMDNFVVFSNTEHATHNAYTQVASELGLPATVVYVLFLVAAIKRVRRYANPGSMDKKKRSLAFLAVGLEASLIGYLVVSFFASVAYLWYVYYIVGYVICVSRLCDSSLSIQSKVEPVSSTVQ
ncbi:MAG TPA: O-antigen ligase family protein [Pyrinomonadaceae bacterium]|jgi:O-antigen ligase|nr:O-antigen ligase family protein [Pyrinomonadaceae bacterium]